MKSLLAPSRWRVGITSLILAVSLVGAAAQSVPGKAEVRAVKGQARYSIGGAAEQPLRVGTVLPQTTTIKTGPASVVDLFLGNSAGVLRVTENSTLSLDRLTLTDAGVDTIVEVQLDLPEGVILGNVNKLSAASKYEIKIPNGVAGIRGTRFRCSSATTLVLMEGSLIFVHVPVGGNPTPYTLTAPPAVVFTPAGGVKPAPANVVTLVGQQLSAPANTAIASSSAPLTGVDLPSNQGASGQTVPGQPAQDPTQPEQPGSDQQPQQPESPTQDQPQADTPAPETPRAPELPRDIIIRVSQTTPAPPPSPSPAR